MIYTTEILSEMLEKHSEWLQTYGERGARFEVPRFADLRSADLRSADLRSADLRSADLRSANLRSANLSSANLRSADLRSANLSSANLRSANLSSANLRSADLRSANLSSANLSSADLSSADLSSANLSSADLSSADLSSARNFTFSVCPEEGAFVGWKSVRGGGILKLQIAENARRVSTPIGRQCRASEVIVLAAYDVDGVEITDTGKVFQSRYDCNFSYRIGETKRVEDFDDSITEECVAGIHFFITRQEAIEYQL